MANKPKRARKAHVSREDWIQAALHALVEGGLDAVAVDIIRIKLGVTRGSFYWHFASRAALVDAVLERWFDRSTTSAVATLQRIADPHERLVALVTEMFDNELVGRMFNALARASTEPQVAKLLERSAVEHLRFVTETFEEMGLARAESRHRALLIVSLYRGLWNVFGVLPNRGTWAFSPEERKRHLAALANELLPPRDVSSPRHRRETTRR